MSRRAERSGKVRAEIARVSPERDLVCQVEGCSNPTVSTAREGFSRTLCRNHVRQKQRHGSAYRKGYLPPELAETRGLARDYLRSFGVRFELWRPVGWAEGRSPVCEDIPFGLRQALFRSGQLLRSAGPLMRPQDMRWLKPKEKARAWTAWARDRGNLTAEKLVFDYLSVRWLWQTDLNGDSSEHFLRHQVARRALLSQASLTKTYQREFNGRVREERQTWLVRFEGRPLQHLGRDILTACEFLEDLTCRGELVGSIGQLRVSNRWIEGHDRIGRT